jgi:hypothetical protein
MASRKISVDDLSVHAYDMSANAVHLSAKIHNAIQKTADYIVEKTDNAVGRLSGISYYAKTFSAMVGGVKDIDPHVIAETLRDDKLSLKQKAILCADHFNDKFNHESVVGAAMFFGKALVLAPIAGGVVALAGAAAPGALAAAGAVAIGAKLAANSSVEHAVEHTVMGAMKKAACYFLSTHQGHHLEATMAEKIKKGYQEIVGVRRAAKGDDPEYGMLAKVAHKMEELGHKIEEQAHKMHIPVGHGGHGHGHDQDHGHGGHGHDAHGHAGHTLWQDIKTVFSVHKYPEELKSFFSGIVKDCVSAYNQMTGSKISVDNAHEHKAPSASKFVQTAAPAVNAPALSDEKPGSSRKTLLGLGPADAKPPEDDGGGGKKKSRHTLIGLGPN